MTTPLPVAPSAHTPDAFEAFVRDLRPELHRYCARMIGSVVDAEDVVQEALAKAYASLGSTSVANLRGWLFRIAHNTAIDHVRRTRNQPMDYLDEHTRRIEPDEPLAEQELVAIALSVFVQLTPKQRSCVILKDVLGYPLADISELLDATVGEIKAALHRGRTRLRELSKRMASDAAAPLHEQEHALLARYIDRFNARDFDAVRAMLADEVRLDLVARSRRQGRAEVGEYFHQYAQRSDWRFTLGMLEHRPAILVYNQTEPTPRPAYIVLLTWEGARITFLRDYRYARYVMQDADVAER